MKRLWIIISLLFLGICCLPKAVFSQEGKPVSGWLDRVEFSFQYETDQKPIFYFQTVPPFYQSEDKEAAFFYQPRISLKNDSLTYNLGLGYRRIVNDSFLFGCNMFADYEDLHEHSRLGLGLEALGQIWEIRLNGYIGGLTTKRVVERSGGAVTYERVADGLDFEIGAPIPYLPWLKIYTSGFWYDFDKFSDKVGWKTRLEAKLNDSIKLEFYTWDDNKGEIEFGGQLRFNLAFDAISDLKAVFTLAGEPFPKKDLVKQMLIPVERNNDIVVEKWTESAGVTIQISRGNN